MRIVACARWVKSRMALTIWYVVLLSRPLLISSMNSVLRGPTSISPACQPQCDLCQTHKWPFGRHLTHANVSHTSAYVCSGSRPVCWPCRCRLHRLLQESILHQPPAQACGKPMRLSREVM